MKERSENRWIEWLIRVSIAMSIICFGVLRHLFGLNEVVGNLLESRLAFSSQMAFLEVHLITILELIFVVFILTSKLSKAFLSFSGLLIVIYLLSFLLSLGNESYIGSDLSSINGFTGVVLVFLVALLLVLSSLRWGGFKTRVPIWLKIMISLMLIVGYSSYYLITSNEFTELGGEYDVKYTDWNKYRNKLSQQKPQYASEKDYTLCFFSTSCNHCNEAAKRLSVYRQLFPDKEILLVFFSKVKDVGFWESDEVIEEFLSRNHLELPYLKIKDYEAVSLGGNQFPAVVEMKDGKPYKHFVGPELNAWAFDYLFK